MRKLIEPTAEPKDKPPLSHASKRRGPDPLLGEFGKTSHTVPLEQGNGSFLLGWAVGYHGGNMIQNVGYVKFISDVSYHDELD
jgi:hypothetical protein